MAKKKVQGLMLGKTSNSKSSQRCHRLNQEKRVGDLRNREDLSLPQVSRTTRVISS